MQTRGLMAGVVLAVVLTACGSGESDTTNAARQRESDRFAIEQIEVKWHKASSTKNINLMMSLWADDATATIGGQTYTGKDQIRNFFLSKAAPFKAENNWVSDTPAYKIRVTVNGDRGTLYFECHYIDVATQQLKAVVAADQNVERIDGRWLITNLVSATPELSV